MASPLVLEFMSPNEGTFTPFIFKAGCILKKIIKHQVIFILNNCEIAADAVYVVHETVMLFMLNTEMLKS